MVLQKTLTFECSIQADCTSEQSNGSLWPRHIWIGWPTSAKSERGLENTRTSFFFFKIFFFFFKETVKRGSYSMQVSLSEYLQGRTWTQAHCKTPRNSCRKKTCCLKKLLTLGVFFLLTYSLRCFLANVVRWRKNWEGFYFSKHCLKIHLEAYDRFKF